MVNDLAIVNIGSINESADPPLEDLVGDDLEDEIPDTYKDQLHNNQSKNANLIWEKLESTAGPRRKPHSKVT